MLKPINKGQFLVLRKYLFCLRVIILQYYYCQLVLPHRYCYIRIYIITPS